MTTDPSALSREPASSYWKLAVDLTGSKLGPLYRSVELVIDHDPEWPPDRIRQEAAIHYDVPVGQVGEPVKYRRLNVPGFVDDVMDLTP